MRPLVFVWPYAVLFWLIYIWAFAPEFSIVAKARKTVAQNKSTDSGSLQVILLGMWIAVFVSFPLAFVSSLSFPARAVLPAFGAGIALLVAGSLLRRHCWRVLGQYFTGDVQVRSEQPVITEGAYRWVRHPSYSAAILMMAGIGVALANWGSLVVLVTVAVLIYSYRVRAEERALVQTLGEPYVAYMKTRKRFVPFVI